MEIKEQRIHNEFKRDKESFEYIHSNTQAIPKFNLSHLISKEVKDCSLTWIPTQDSWKFKVGNRTYLNDDIPNKYRYQFNMHRLYLQSKYLIYDKENRT